VAKPETNASNSHEDHRFRTKSPSSGANEGIEQKQASSPSFPSLLQSFFSIATPFRPFEPSLAVTTYETMPSSLIIRRRLFISIGKIAA
jgi:hypothetical protein